MKPSATMQRIAKDYTDLQLSQVITQRGIIRLGNLVFASYSPTGRLWEVKGFYVRNFHYGQHKDDDIEALLKPAFKSNFEPIKNGSENLRHTRWLFLPDIDMWSNRASRMIQMIDTISGGSPLSDQHDESPINDSQRTSALRDTAVQWHQKLSNADLATIEDRRKLVGVRIYRFFMLLWTEIMRTELSRRAAALTYTTILSIFPLLAVVSATRGSALPW